MISEDIVNRIFDISCEGIFYSKTTNLCYNKIQKVACTSLSYWINEIEYVSKRYNKEKILQGIQNLYNSENVSLKNILCGTADDINDEFSIFDITRISKNKIFEIFNSKNNFSFAVVRNPYLRIFSTWADKILQDRLPKNSLYFNDFACFHKPVLSVDDARLSIETFLESLKLNRGGCFCDNHYAPQIYILRPDILKYDCIVQLENQHILTEKINSWLGYEYLSPFYIRKNKNILKYHHVFFTDKSIELIKNIYKCDFLEFGYDPDAVPMGKYEVANEYIEKLFLSFLEKRLRNLSQYRYASFALIKANEKLREKNANRVSGKIKARYKDLFTIIKKK